MSDTNQDPVTTEELVELAQERIELKNVQIDQRLSEETVAFSASVYLDGEVAATAKNRGRGGETMIHRFHDGRSDTFKDQIEELREFVDTLPPLESSYEELDSLSTTLELVVSQLVSHYDLMNAVKRHIRDGKLVFRTSDQKYGEFSYVGHRGDPQEALEAMRDRHDVEKVYNDL